MYYHPPSNLEKKSIGEKDKHLEVNFLINEGSYFDYRYSIFSLDSRLSF